MLKEDQNFKLVLGDIRDKEVLQSVFKGIDICIHAAAAINVQESIDNPQKYYDVNIDGTFNFLEEARRKDVKWF